MPTEGWNVERNRTSRADGPGEQQARKPPGQFDALLARLSTIAPAPARGPGRQADGAPSSPVERDLTFALDLIQNAPKIIEQFRSRASEMEARIEALLQSAGQELRAAEARVREAEQRAREAEARALAAQQRLEHAEAWTCRLAEAIESSFAALRESDARKGDAASSPPA